jgi:uncharacterized protein YbjQ (UPF0145 family)
MDLIIFLTLLACGYFVGSWAERKHYASIEAREKDWLYLPVTNCRKGFNISQVTEAGMVQGNAVISVDYFKRLLASLRNIFGGTIRSYETLLDRARREALLRMKESAPAGTSMIVNVRVETSTIGKNSHKKGVGCVEAIAYGTALTLKENDAVHSPVA